MNLFGSVILTLLLAGYGFKKGSLNLSGALAAIPVGLSITLNKYLWCTFVLFAFFISSSKLTKYKSEIKKTLEEDHVEGGQRNWIQAICNGLTPSLFSILATYYDSELGNVCNFSNPWAAFFLYGMIGHFACCNGDTWASELGVLNPDWPYLITTFQQVPPGTNGGMSTLGTLASGLGGQLIGLTATLVLKIQYPECRFRWSLMGLGLMAGLIGSLIDSLLGATMQATYINKYNQIIFEYNPKLHKDAKHITGKDILSNNQINLISSLVTACFSGLIGCYFL